MDSVSRSCVRPADAAASIKQSPVMTALAKATPASAGRPILAAARQPCIGSLSEILGRQLVVDRESRHGALRRGDDCELDPPRGVACDVEPWHTCFLVSIGLDRPL